MVQPLSDNAIAIRIVPLHVRWPERGTSNAWTKAYNAVDALRNLGRDVDRDCLEAEQDRQLSGDGLRRRREEICDEALGKLVSFQAFEIAQKAMSENIAALERAGYLDPTRAQMHQKLTTALADLREGVAATRRTVLERCRMRQSVSV